MARGRQDGNVGVERGEVWWARLPQPIGARPVLLLSRNQAYRVRKSVTLALITSTIREIPVEVPLGPEDGMPHLCVVNCDEVHTVAMSLLDKGNRHERGENAGSRQRSPFCTRRGVRLAFLGEAAGHHCGVRRRILILVVSDVYSAPPALRAGRGGKSIPLHGSRP